MKLILARSLIPAPIRIDVDSFNPITGAVSATVTMYSTTYALSEADFNILLIEEDVNTTPTTYDDTHIARALFSDTITLTGVGNTAEFNTVFSISPSWNTSNLRAIAFVQLSDESIIQVGSSDPMPAFKARAMVPCPRVLFGSSSGVTSSGDFTIMNLGLTESFTMEVVVDEAPPGWQFAITDEVGTVHNDPFAFGLANDESTFFHVDITPDSSGQATFHVEISSPNLAREVVIPFSFFTDDFDVMLVDDDGDETYEDYFTAALDSAGYSYRVWDRALNELTADVVEHIQVLVWNAGWSFPCLDQVDRAFLTEYLDEGRALFLSGQDIGWELNDPDGSPDPVWYETTFHAHYVRDNTGIHSLFGVTGDPVSDGLSLVIEGGTGASNQQYPDQIEAADSDATVIFNYQDDGGGAIRAIDSSSHARIVYLGFGFEGIADAQDRLDLLKRSVEWIGPEVFSDGFESNSTGAWDVSVP